MCTIIRPPPTWADSYRRRGWVWTRFYLVPPPPPSFGDDASSINYPISSEDESPTIESVVFVVSGLLMCLNVCTSIIFDDMPKLNSCTCFECISGKRGLTSGRSALWKRWELLRGTWPSRLRIVLSAFRLPSDGFRVSSRQLRRRHLSEDLRPSPM